MPDNQKTITSKFQGLQVSSSKQSISKPISQNLESQMFVPQSSAQRQRLIKKTERVKTFWQNHKVKNHQQRINYLTGKHPKQTSSFNKLSNWRELRSWILNQTINVQEQMILPLMVSYHNHAIELQENGKLRKDHDWMLEANFK